MKWMTKMEDIVMNLTGCHRQIANTVVNTILDEDRKATFEAAKEAKDDKPV